MESSGAKVPGVFWNSHHRNGQGEAHVRSNKIMRFGFFPTLFCLVAMLLAACGSGGVPGSTGAHQPKAPNNQQVYRYGDVITDIASFDPPHAADQPPIEARQMVFTR